MASKDEVLQVALLSRLSVDGERIESLTHEFNAILDYVKALEEVDVNSIDPLSHVHGSVNVFREDTVVHSLTSEQGFRNAPDQAEGSFRVPLVVNHQKEE